MGDEHLHIWTVWHPGPERQTFEQHEEILKKSPRKVYWGVINKKDKIHLAHKSFIGRALEKLKDQTKNKKQTQFFVTPLDPGLPFLWGEVSEIRSGTEFENWRTSDLIPAYYKKLIDKSKDIEITYWFLLTRLSKISNQEIYQKIEQFDYSNGKLINVTYSREKYGEEGYPFPCLCKFTGDIELSEYFKEKCDYLWRQVGENWLIKFQGKPQIISNLDGLKYIEHLLRSPNKSIEVLKLYQISKSSYFGNPIKDYDINPHIEDELCNSEIKTQGTINEIIDHKTQLDISKRIESLQKKMRESNSAENVEQRLNHEKEIEDLNRYLKSAVGVNGSSRGFPDVREKARKAVSKTINYTIKKIEVNDAILAKHLKQAIQKGYELVYSPVDSIPWQF